MNGTNSERINQRLLIDPVFQSFASKHIYLLREYQNRHIVARGALELLRDFMSLLNRGYLPEEIDRCIDSLFTTPDELERTA